MRHLRPLGGPLSPGPALAEVCADFEPYQLIQARPEKIGEGR